MIIAALKRKSTLFLAATASLSLALTGCANGEGTTETVTVTEHAEQTTTSPTEADSESSGGVSDVFAKEIGEPGGMGCTDPETEDCAVVFQVSSIVPLGECVDPYDEQPAGTMRVAVTVDIDTTDEPITDTLDAGDFNSITSWSVADANGNDQPVSIETWCGDVSDKTWWWEPIFPGDTVSREMHFEMPVGAQELRLTQDFGNSRWTWTMPETAPQAAEDSSVSETS